MKANKLGRSLEWFDLTKRLSNYIDTQESVAKSKGCWEELKKARTLTEARRIVYGVKGKGKALS